MDIQMYKPFHRGFEPKTNITELKKTLIKRAK